MSPKAPRTVIDGLAFAEGIRFVGGRLWLSDMHDRRVYCVDPTTGEVLAEHLTPDKPSGLVVRAEGTVAVVQMETRTVAEIAPDGEMRDLAALGAVADWHANDMTGDGRGGLYVGNFGDDSVPPAPPRPARLAHVAPDGTVRAVADDLHFPNGMVLVDGGATLLVAETRPDPPRITAFDVADDGSLSARRVFAEFSGTLMPDGVAVTDRGEVLVAMPFAQCLLLLDADGSELARYDTDAMPYACAVDDVTRTAYACLSSSWEEAACLERRDSRVVGFGLGE